MMVDARRVGWVPGRVQKRRIAHDRSRPSGRRWTPFPSFRLVASMRGEPTSRRDDDAALEASFACAVVPWLRSDGSRYSVLGTREGEGREDNGSQAAIHCYLQHRARRD